MAPPSRLIGIAKPIAARVLPATPVAFGGPEGVIEGVSFVPNDVEAVPTEAAVALEVEEDGGGETEAEEDAPKEATGRGASMRDGRSAGGGGGNAPSPKSLVRGFTVGGGGKVPVFAAAVSTDPASLGYTSAEEAPCTGM